MTNEPRYWAVLLIGPPGAGKDTQADLLSNELGLIEIKTSRIIEEKFKTADPNDTIIAEQKTRKERGELVESSITEKWVNEKVREIAGNHDGTVFSGSPRTIAEAESELPVIAELYQKDAIKIVYISLSQDESVKRNQFRRTCQANGHPIPNFPEFENLALCPKDGSPIVKRQDDTPETIINRYQVYLRDTVPVLDWLKSQGYTIVQITGEQSIEDVHREILNHLW